MSVDAAALVAIFVQKYLKLFDNNFDCSSSLSLLSIL